MGESYNLHRCELYDSLEGVGLVRVTYLYYLLLTNFSQGIWCPVNVKPRSVLLTILCIESGFKYGQCICTKSMLITPGDLLRLPLAKTTKYQGSFRFNGVRAFNTLPLSIRSVNELKEFKIQAKHHLKRYSALFLMCFHICISCYK